VKVDRIPHIIPANNPFQDSTERLIYIVFFAIQPKAYLAVLLSHTVPQQGIPEMTIMKDKNKKDQPSVAKVVELIGSSPNSWEEATENAVEAAAKTLRNIRGVDVQRFKAKVKDNRIVEYRVDVKIAFIVEME